MPVLAKGAVEVTPGKTQREYLAAGAEMVERLFFNGVKGPGGDVSIVRNTAFPSTVKPYPTAAGSAIRQDATPWAKLALNGIL